MTLEILPQDRSIRRRAWASRRNMGEWGEEGCGKGKQGKGDGVGWTGSFPNGDEACMCDLRSSPPSFRELLEQPLRLFVAKRSGGGVTDQPFQRWASKRWSWIRTAETVRGLRWQESKRGSRPRPAGRRVRHRELFTREPVNLKGAPRLPTHAPAPATPVHDRCSRETGELGLHPADRSRFGSGPASSESEFSLTLLIFYPTATGSPPTLTVVTAAGTGYGRTRTRILGDCGTKSAPPWAIEISCVTIPSLR